MKQYKKRHAARQEKMSGTMGFEKPKPGHLRTSQLKAVGHRARYTGKRKGTGAEDAKRSKWYDLKKNDSTEILSVLQSLKESYESGQITEAAFLKLATPILEKFGSNMDQKDFPPGQPKAGENPPKKLKLKAPKQKKGLKWKENDSSSFGSKADKG